MLNIYITSTKYILIILFAFFTYFAFNTLRNTPEEYKNKLLKRQRAILYILHFMAFILILINNSDKVYQVIIFYGCQLLYFIFFLGLTGVFFDGRISRPLVNSMSMMLCMSLIILTRLSLDKAFRQFAILLAATVIFFLVLFLFNKIKSWPRATWLYCVLGLGLLLVVLVMGDTSNGAKLSVDLKFFSVQPLEFVKIFFVFFLAALFEKSTSFKNVIISAVFAGAHVILLVLSRDLGSALILFVVYLFVLYSVTQKRLYLLSGTLGGAVAAVIGYKLFSHVRIRVLAWLNPWSVLDNEGYQITQSLFAIGTGGWLGMGLFQGRPSDIPVVEQDFVFSAISEELGGFFALCLIFLCLCCFLSFIRISMEQGERFYKTVVLGLSLVYVVQVFLTIGGAIKLIPSTGVTLPLVSYGGSSLVATIIIFGIILAIGMKNNTGKLTEKDNGKKAKEKSK
ncbi:FtsW/RodA/SpoVE family cell cycle protein [Parasporobacterium paucivorans]|uniref:Cell division protein FtsW, lipid II flippase n=1 Tax=Parasporobacterium paucivorans DSM 15970 TaxID=1122934 RepID=A0A1M6ABL1_9FIRM|nr:FtsW/RodA/SpoVE family cell cycle protein [Parasporobacterium paucivorans]SHI33839.1 cell division protein FtsW, lipid II flippase [Parasporobacterium paucivorans DSM 15970]